ncbi:hypothetical protein LY12_003448 [Prauserella alba]|uniref:Mce-associated membrane protein n=2 Tax=Prauserella alba TaxID=176898 RepID=A0ABN1VJP5_9PSEU|nr:hypothetical protein [Prauserella alba]
MLWGTVMTHHRSTGFVVAILVGVAVSACSSATGGNPPSSPAPSSESTATSAATTTATPTPAETAGDRAIRAYLGMWRDMAAAAKTSDWRSPRLARNATGKALSRISRGLYADHYNGLVTKGEPRNNPEVEAVTPADNPTTVDIVDCGDDSDWVKYHADTGKPANDGPGGRRHITARVEKAVDGSWKVTDFAIQDVGTC